MVAGRGAFTCFFFPRTITAETIINFFPLSATVENVGKGERWVQQRILIALQLGVCMRKAQVGLRGMGSKNFFLEFFFKKRISCAGKQNFFFRSIIHYTNEVAQLSCASNSRRDESRKI